MVCFCDIPLARLGEHIGFYGEFGIGVTREWADTNNLNPLIYLSTSTPVAVALSRVLGNNNLASTGEYYPLSANDINSIITYVKPVFGYVNVGGVPTKKEFYQENEWRYVPNDPAVKQWISKEDHLDQKVLDTYNNTSKQNGSLQITPKDIKYIFVKSDSDIPIIIDYIQSELGDFTGNDLKILMSRVISPSSISLDL